MCGNRRGRISGVSSLRTASKGRAGCTLHRQSLYGQQEEHRRLLLHNPYFELLRHDITYPLYIEVDEIYNLACPASPIHYQNDPVQTTKVNVHGSINMLGLAKRLKIRIMQASTSEVYGNPFVHPQKETYWGNVNPIGPRSCYDEGKRCAETLFFDYNRQHRLDIKVARIFNTYGPRMHPNDGRVVSNFIVQALDRTAYNYLWRRQTDPIFLLCRRPDRRLHQTDEYPQRLYRPGQSRKPRRVHHHRTCGYGARNDRIKIRTGSKTSPAG